VKVISIADPAHPFVLTEYDSAGYEVSVFLQGDLLYMTSENPTCVRVISVADPEHPEDLGFYPLTMPAWRMHAAHPYVYIADRSGAVVILEYYGPSAITDFGDDESRVPVSYSLLQNYPNPFNPSTTITFELPGDAGAAQRVWLVIYDLRGRMVKTLIERDLESGSHRVAWDGTNERGQAVASGVYFSMLRTDQTGITKKMLLCK
jgi:hypothetical protein